MSGQTHRPPNAADGGSPRDTGRGRSGGTRRSDADLLQAWRDGDTAAGQELFTRYYPPLLRFFSGKVHVDPTDLIQETLLGCVHGQQRLRDGQRFRSFLFGIAYNVVREAYRRGRVHEARVSPMSHSAADPAPGPSTVVGADEQQRRLLSALRRLPLEHQVVLELFYWEELDSAQISMLMDEPRGTIRTRLRRARQLLARALQSGAQAPTTNSSLADLAAWSARLRGLHLASAVPTR